MRAEVLKLKGVMAVTYDAEADVFTVRCESVLASLEAIFTAVFAAGKMMGREYFPELIK